MTPEATRSEKDMLQVAAVIDALARFEVPYLWGAANQFGDLGRAVVASQIPSGAEDAFVAACYL